MIRGSMKKKVNDHKEYISIYRVKKFASATLLISIIVMLVAQGHQGIFRPNPATAGVPSSKGGGS